MSQTVAEFIHSYQGFDFQEGEIVIVDQRNGKQLICSVETKEAYIHIAGGNRLTMDTILSSGGTNAAYWMPRVYEQRVWHWTHTSKTMLIVV